ncbi:MAG TPA: DNRLRE domain-containing protein [Saprospiraceae bacterium]|nr:DNRLRE domain-containing protein [Saprospiraceae bacterium]
MKNLCVIISILFSSALSGQGTIILQPDPAAGKDASIFNLNALGNYGSDVDFIASQWDYSGEPGTVRSLIQFDLSSIPKGQIVFDARLSLYYNNESTTPGQAGNNAAYLRRIIQPWDESTVAWNGQPFYTTDNEVLLPSSAFPDQDYESIDVTNLVNDMVENQANSFGFMFMLQTEQGLNSMKFYSSDAANPDERPRLEITYATVANNDVFFQETSIRPNPFDHSIILENLNGKFLINITDVSGRNVFTAKEESVDGKIVLNNLFNLSKGIYFVTAENESQRYFSKAVK